MPANEIFLIDMVLGYVAWALVIATYVWPRLKAMDHVGAHRTIATFNSFRFFGLVFLLPGFVGQNLPAGWAATAAYGDLATGVLAIFALLTVRRQRIFWPLVWTFNLVGLADLVIDTLRAASIHLPEMAGQLGAGFAIPILYVPALFWAHIVAFRLLLRPAREAAHATEAPVPVAL
jgi:hypothetical protein